MGRRGCMGGIGGGGAVVVVVEVVVEVVMGKGRGLLGWGFLG